MTWILKVLFWKYVAIVKTLTGRKKFEKVLKVVKLLFCWPFSIVEAEKLFSLLKSSKSGKRNQLASVALYTTVKTNRGVKRKGGHYHMDVNNPLKNRLKRVRSNETSPEC